MPSPRLPKTLPQDPDLFFRKSSLYGPLSLGCHARSPNPQPDFTDLQRRRPGKKGILAPVNCNRRQRGGIFGDRDIDKGNIVITMCRHIIAKWRPFNKIR